MKISAFIKRLRELRTIAGDVEVAVGMDGDGCYDEASAELVKVVPMTFESKIAGTVTYWKCLDEDNTEQIVTVY